MDELSEITRNHYDDLISRIGDDYIDCRWKQNPISFSHYKHTHNSVKFFFNEINPMSENLLEIGCGPGTWTDICLKNAKCMTIVDISREMLKLVMDRFEGKKIDFHCGDFISSQINLLPIYDTIFSARALEYMDDKRAMVEKSASLLLPGGFIAIITKNPAWRDKKREDQIPSENDIQRDWIHYRNLEEIFIVNGLEDVRTYPVCLGSYYFPFNNSIAIGFLNLLQKSVYCKVITPALESFSESYMTIGRKPKHCD